MIGEHHTQCVHGWRGPLNAAFGVNGSLKEFQLVLDVIGVECGGGCAEATQMFR